MQGTAGWRLGKLPGGASGPLSREGPALGCSPSRWITNTLPLFKSLADPIDLPEPGREGLLFHRPPPDNPVQLGLHTGLVVFGPGAREGCSPGAARVFVPQGVRCPKATSECPARRVPPPEASGGLRTNLEKEEPDLATAMGMSPFLSSLKPRGPPKERPPPPTPPLRGNTYFYLLYIRARA